MKVHIYHIEIRTRDLAVWPWIRQALGDQLEPVPEAVADDAENRLVIPQRLDLRGEPLYAGERHLKASMMLQTTARHPIPFFDVPKPWLAAPPSGAFGAPLPAPFAESESASVHRAWSPQWPTRRHRPFPAPVVRSRRV